jgi:predicted Fe-S protein YdhL (DUF1289 family)
MRTRWETREEKLLRWMKVPAKRKMEILYELHQMAVKNKSKKTRRIRLALKRAR